MNKQMTVQPIYGILLNSKKEHIFEAYSHWDEFQRNLAEFKKNSQQLTILLYHVYNILEITLNIMKMENWLVVARV